MTDLSKKIMNQIEKEHVEMKPKIYFVAGYALLGVGLAGAMLTSIMFSNLAFHRFRMHGVFARPFPLIHLLLIILFILLGLKLLKKYEFSHKYSLWGLVITMITAVVLFGFLMDRLGVNERLSRRKHFERLYQGGVKGYYIERRPSPRLYK